MAQTTFGQTDSLALAVVAFLNGMAASFCLPMSAERRFALVTDLSLIPAYDAPVSIDVFPDIENTERHGQSTFTSDYAVHIFIQQRTDGTDEEAACALLTLLRSQIIEALKPQHLALANAIHPLAAGSVVMTHARSADRSPGNPAGLYNLYRLLEAHVFESDTIVIFKAAA
jgi:hypothetical protein